MSHAVVMPWHSSHTETYWNESCADVIEVFGLPGGRYTTQVNPDLMIFNFVSKKDAELCRILLSEKIL
jgi:hypothetical protein